jgi:hypothetical protein
MKKSKRTKSLFCYGPAAPSWPVCTSVVMVIYVVVE